MATSIVEGVIKSYSPQDGYGFVIIDGVGDVFLHRRCLEEHHLITPPVGRRRVKIEMERKKGKPRVKKILEFRET